MDNKVIFNKELIQRCDKFGPRYTSYPTAVQFTDNVSDENYLNWVDESNNNVSS